jgi:hypothetical protein
MMVEGVRSQRDGDNGEKEMGLRQWGWESRRKLIVTAVVATSALAACDDSLSGLDGTGQLVDGVLYRVTELLIAESFPVKLGVTVELENLSTAPPTVVFPDGCVVLMRANADGGDPAWDMGADRGCTQALVEVQLEAGEIREFQTGLVSAATILEGGLPAGEYRITAYLRPADTVEIEAGSVDLALAP